MSAGFEDPQSDRVVPAEPWQEAKRDNADLLLCGGSVLLGPGCGRREWVARKLDVVVRGDRISDLVEPGVRLPPSLQVLDCRGCIVLPGLHNLHAHFCEAAHRSLRDGLAFELWLPQKAAVDYSVCLSPAEMKTVVASACVEAIRSGTTSALHHFYCRPDLTVEHLDAIIEAYVDTGLRVCLVPALTDKSLAECIGSLHEGTCMVPDVSLGNRKQACDRLIELAEYAIVAASQKGGRRVTSGVGPAAPHMCSDELLEKAFDLAKRRGTLVHTHVLETKRQRMLGRQRWPGGVVRHLERSGYLGRHLSVAHAVWVESEEIEVLAAHGVTVSHNPASNLKLGSGVAPVPEMLRTGLNVGIGTDGADTSDTYSIADQLYLAALMHRRVDEPHLWVTAEDVLYMATVAGGAYLNVGQTGAIDTGKLADLIVVPLGWDPDDGDRKVAADLILGGSLRSVRDVIIGGKLVLACGRNTFIDEEALRGEMARIRAKVRRAALRCGGSLQDITERTDGRGSQGADSLRRQGLVKGMSTRRNAGRVEACVRNTC